MEYRLWIDAFHKTNPPDSMQSSLLPTHDRSAGQLTGGDLSSLSPMIFVADVRFRYLPCPITCKPGPRPAAKFLHSNPEAAWSSAKPGMPGHKQERPSWISGIFAKRLRGSSLWTSGHILITLPSYLANQTFTFFDVTSRRRFSPSNYSPGKRSNGLQVVKRVECHTSIFNSAFCLEIIKVISAGLMVASEVSHNPKYSLFSPAIVNHVPSS